MQAYVQFGYIFSFNIIQKIGQKECDIEGNPLKWNFAIKFYLTFDNSTKNYCDNFTLLQRYKKLSRFVHKTKISLLIIPLIGKYIDKIIRFQSLYLKAQDKRNTINPKAFLSLFCFGCTVISQNFDNLQLSNKSFFVFVLLSFLKRAATQTSTQI